MSIKLIINTLKHLKGIQIYKQITNRIINRRIKHLHCVTDPRPLNYTDWIPKAKCKTNNKLSFLNIERVFSGWEDTSNGNLWAYNLNYMDWLNQKKMSFDEGAIWIDRFITDLNGNKIGTDPYPTALRGVNWIKFISKYYSKIDSVRRKIWNDSLYSQYEFLNNHLEFHLLGNHLLEDVFSLFIASLYFGNIILYRKSTKILRKQLKEQILNDGAHYEQSPMYHCILLDRLLDCYNFSLSNHIFKDQYIFTETLRGYAVMMLGHLDSIIYKDGNIPLLNDAAFKIAPSPSDIFEYAKRLNINWTSIPLSESGYRRFEAGRVEGIIDIGDIKASYQPGHTHADTFSYELRIDGKPFIIDTGTSTYEKNLRRQYERSTSAHNTVSIDSKDSSEVWGGFRVANRAFVTVLEDSNLIIKASLQGFSGNLEHTREFNLYEGLNVIDEISKGHHGISRIHFASNIKVKIQDNRIITDKALIIIEGADKISLTEEAAATEYNTLQTISKVEIHFTEKMEYRILI